MTYSVRRLFAALLALGAAPFPARAVGPTTHVEFDLSHTERVANVNTVLTDSDLPGIDGTFEAVDTGHIDGTYGNHDVSLAATVDTSSGKTRLRARGQHSFDLSGLNTSTDQWRLVNGTQTLRSTHVDVLDFVGAPPATLTVEMYWDVRGKDDVLVDILPSQAINLNLHTDVSLTATTVAPNSGGGSFDETVPWPNGLRTADLDQEKRVEPDEEYVVMTFTAQPGQSLEVSTTLEVTPVTTLSNSFEGLALNTSTEGHHDARFDETNAPPFDQSAVLVGVIVRDNLGNVLPGIQIVADSGNDYPVLDAVPTPPPPPRVILSPVSAVPDIGEFSGQTPAINMINQTGLAKGFTSGVSSFDHYFDFNPVPLTNGTFTNNWQSLVDFSLPLTGNVDFDLGEQQVIDRLALWNTSLQNIRVLVADAPLGPFTQVGAYTLSNHIPSLSYLPDVLSLNGLHSARYLRVAIDSAYKFSASDTFTYAIVGEAAVSAVPVPEPDAWLMLAAGAPAVALLGRRRLRTLQRASSGGAAARDDA